MDINQVMQNGQTVILEVQCDSSAFAQGWSPTLLTNFQVDSYAAGSASSTVYLDDLTIYRW
jgi:hypothetical protein